MINENENKNDLNASQEINPQPITTESQTITPSVSTSTLLERLKTKKFIFIGVLLVLTILIGGVGFFYFKGKKTVNQNRPNSYTKSTQLTPTPSSTLINQTTIEPTCLDDKTNVDYSMPQDGSDGILAIIKTYTDGREQTSFTVEGVAEKVVEPVEIQRCYLYVIKPLSDKQWQLWRYNFDNKGEVLYTGNRFQFRVNKPETLIGLNTYTDSKEHIIILEIASKKQILDKPVDEVKNKLSGTIGSDVLEVVGNDLRGWNANGSELWGSLYAVAYVEAFWKLNIDGGEITVFSDFPLAFPNGVALNPDKELVAYSDRPLSFDVESSEAWQKENTTYSLYLYSLKNRTSKLISTLPASWPGGMINPIVGWDSPTELRYSTPNGQRVYTYTE